MEKEKDKKTERKTGSRSEKPAGKSDGSEVRAWSEETAQDGQRSDAAARPEGRPRPEAEEINLEERLVFINRVAKVVKGGKRFGFAALMVVGDRRGQVGFAVGKARDISEAIRKGKERAKKSLIKVSLHGSTVRHQVIGKFGASRVLIKPAVPGTGVIAGGAVRAVMEMAGVHDILTKSLKSNNPFNVVRATINGLQSMMRDDKVAAARGVELGSAKPEEN